MTRLRPAAGVAVIDTGDVVYVAPLPEGPIVVLDGVAAAIWAEATSGQRSTIAGPVAALTDATVGAVGAGVEAFVDELLERGLLEQKPA